jgi:hypothetical protein
MSHNQHGGAHPYRGTRGGRGARLKSKLGRSLSLKRLEQLLKPRKKEKTDGDQDHRSA